MQKIAYFTANIIWDVKVEILWNYVRSTLSLFGTQEIPGIHFGNFHWKPCRLCTTIAAQCSVLWWSCEDTGHLMIMSTYSYMQPNLQCTCKYVINKTLQEPVHKPSPSTLFSTQNLQKHGEENKEKEKMIVFKALQVFSNCSCFFQIESFIHVFLICWPRVFVALWQGGGGWE